jgi:hypothetical protein
MTGTSLHRYAVLLAGTVLLLGCPNVESGAPTVCTKAYDKCTLPSGVLGVCDSVPCADGGDPCLVCRSQH